MATFSGLMPTHAAHQINAIPELSFRSNKSTTRSMSMLFTIKPSVGRISTSSMRWQHVKHLRSCCASSKGGNYQEWNVENEYQQEPFWLFLFREAVSSTKSVFSFLSEQPSQLKYIEWPDFQSTLKTASLTLLLMVLLMIALSSTDSALSYILTMFLRRKI